MAVFGSEEEGMQAHSALVANGFDPSNVAISIDLTRDAIAAEAPGQAYDNQGPSQSLWKLLKNAVDGDADAEEAHVLADVQRGGVVLTVQPLPRSKHSVAVCILKEHRAVAIREVRLAVAKATRCSHSAWTARWGRAM